MQIGAVAERTSLSLRTLMRGLLDILDTVEAGPVTDARGADLTGRLALYRQIAERRIEALRSQSESAEAFTEDLRDRGQARSRPVRRR